MKKPSTIKKTYGFTPALPLKNLLTKVFVFIMPYMECYTYLNNPAIVNR